MIRKSRLSAYVLITVHFMCAGIAADAQTPDPDSRPILFVHGFCGSSSSWQTLRSNLYTRLQSLGSLYPSATNYDVYYDSSSDTTTFLDSSGKAVDESAIPASTRFFSIKFRDPIIGNFSPQGVNRVSTLNKAYELSRVIKRVLVITHSSDIILITHSMGGWLHVLTLKIWHRRELATTIKAIRQITKTQHVRRVWEMLSMRQTWRI